MLGFALCVFSFSVAQFNPDLVLVSAGYDSALGDEKVVWQRGTI